MLEQEFAGKKVLVTGSAGVVGSWISDAFANVGARLLLSDIRGEKLAVQQAKLTGNASEVLTHTTNLLDETSMSDLTQMVQERWGAPDILINNAGLYHRYYLGDMSLENWDEVMGVNVRAPFFLSQQMANLMIEQKVAGNIINLISGASFSTGSGGGGHYSTSKAAVAMLTRAFALELAPYHIRVNGVGPGFAPGSEVSLLSDDYTMNMISTIPLGRCSGPEDAPAAIMFLCSKHASFITGALLNVDGGKSAGNFKKP